MSSDANAFDARAEEYDRWFDSPEGRALFVVELDAVRLLMHGLEHPFLEIGVGTGRFAEALGTEYGIDPSPKVLQIARSRGVIVQKAEGEALPYDDGSFGAVFMLFTLCFVQDTLRALEEAKRVLKRSGRLIVGIINRESPWGQRAVKKREEGHPIYAHARFYGAGEVEKILKRAGLESEACSSALFQPQGSATGGGATARNGLVEGAGFICIRCGKP